MGKELYNNSKGEAGEKFASFFYGKTKIPFIKATKEEDLKLGIDAYIDNKATDIKNTTSIYFCQFFEDGKINVRHPFKKNTKATHYCFVEVDSDNYEKGKVIEFISIEDKLLRDYFIDKDSLESFKRDLQELEHKKSSTLGISKEQSAYKLKMSLMKYLKPSATISYYFAESQTEFTLKILSIIEKPIIKNVLSAFEKIKERINFNKNKDNTIIIRI